MEDIKDGIHIFFTVLKIQKISITGILSPLEQSKFTKNNQDPKVSQLSLLIKETNRHFLIDIRALHRLKMKSRRPQTEFCFGEWEYQIACFNISMIQNIFLPFAQMFMGEGTKSKGPASDVVCGGFFRVQGVMLDSMYNVGQISNVGIM